MIAPNLLTIELPEEVRRAAEIEARLIRRLLAPRPDLSIIDWAEQYRGLPATDGGGMWRVRMVPYLRTPLLALSDARTKEVAILKSAQAGATIGVLLNWILYSIHLDPSNILVLLPTEGEAQKFSKKKFKPAYDACEALAGLIADRRGRTGDNSVLEKSFPGGSLGMIGGVSSRGLRMVDARRYAADDIDALDDSTAEGDQIELLRGRAQAQANAQGLFISSPSEEGRSKIMELYLEMERRGRYHVPCPQCGAMQVLRFGDEETPYGLKWESYGGGVDRREHDPDSVYYLCEANACEIREQHKYEMAQAGEYLTEEGEPVYDGRHRTYGFWFNALVALFPAVSWPNIVRRWLKAKDDPDKRRVFVNTILAETYSDRETTVAATALEQRAQLYRDAEGNRIEVPDGVGLLVAFADVQHDRIELLVRGYGEREVSWQILHHRIYGDTSQPGPFRELDAWLTRTYRHANGRAMRIEAAGVDSGDGSRQTEVYDFVRPRQGRGVWATKGAADPRMKEPVRVPPRKSKRSGIRLVLINTQSLKRTLFWRLTLEARPDRSLPHGFMHFRAAEPTWHNGSDAEFFAQFEREKPRRVKDRKGRIHTEWHQTGPNEAVDLEVGCIAMLRVLEAQRPGLVDRLGRLAEEARRVPREQETDEKGSAAREPRPPAQPAINPWAYAWRQ